MYINNKYVYIYLSLMYANVFYILMSFDMVTSRLLMSSNFVRLFINTDCILSIVDIIYIDFLFK